MQKYKFADCRLFVYNSIWKGWLIMTRSFSRRPISIIISIMIVFAFMPILGQDAYAAAKKPGTPKITSAQVNANTVSLQWSKAKNAKKYKVFVQTGADGWKYWKSVKATKQNKKKYSDKLKYKLKKSGKKYKVYKKKNPYKLVKTTTARKYSYKGKYSTTYRFVVRAVNGKKAGNYSAAKAVKTGAKPKAPADASLCRSADTRRCRRRRGYPRYTAVCFFPRHRDCALNG